MTNDAIIDSLGFSKAYIPPKFDTIERHMHSLGGIRSTSDVGASLLAMLFGNSRLIMSDLYPFVILPTHMDISDAIKQPYIMGGYTPNGKAHLGSLLHINSINIAENVSSKVISFNDLDTKTSIRKVDRIVEKDSIDSFRKICRPNTIFKKRTDDRNVMHFLNAIERDINDQDFYMVLGRPVSEDERRSLNIQAAAYLLPQINNKNSIVIGFDGIEEAARSVWINFVASKFGLPGFVNFISMQVPDFKANLKMGKSNSHESLMVGDSLKSSIEKMLTLHSEAYILFFLFFLIECIFRNIPSSSYFSINVERNMLRIGVMRSAPSTENDKFTFEDWFLILHRVRLFLAYQDSISSDKVELESVLISGNIPQLLLTKFGKFISFADVEGLARYFSSNETPGSSTQTEFVLNLRLDEFESFVTKLKGGRNDSDSPYLFIDNNPGFDIEKMRLLAINALIQKHPGIFPLKD